ncbi:unnamed protein product [Closterium sp. Naga37s-1]|nr:unnamed protein product [Closterium sp. Naga37s-1]
MTRGEPASGSSLRRRTAVTSRYPWSTRQCLVCVLAVAALNVLLFHLHGDSIEQASRGFRALILESSGRRGSTAGGDDDADWEGEAAWSAAEGGGGVGEGGGEAEPTTDINMKRVYDGIKFANEKGGKWTQGWKLQYKGDEWDDEPLRVFVVPHSHNDPGWLLTVEQYYARSSQHILHTILHSLSEATPFSNIPGHSSLLSLPGLYSLSQATTRSSRPLMSNSFLVLVAAQHRTLALPPPSLAAHSRAVPRLEFLRILKSYPLALTLIPAYQTRSSHASLAREILISLIVLDCNLHAPCPTAPPFLQSPSRRFIWEEMSYLSRWWVDATQEEREGMRALVQSGQLEIVGGGWVMNDELEIVVGVWVMNDESGQLDIVGGGWVMNDEANSHYYAIIEQLTEGNTWLYDTLGVTPTNSWAIDPFGHSATMPYLLKRSGFANMLIQRTHYEVKKALARQKHLEFFWRQAWDQTGGTMGQSERTVGQSGDTFNSTMGDELLQGQGRSEGQQRGGVQRQPGAEAEAAAATAAAGGEEEGSTDILCHMMPFFSYDIPHTCGPNPGVCCQVRYTYISAARCVTHT